MLKEAIAAALHAGEAILEVYDRDFDVEFKADDSPLTAADTASHDIIVRALESTPHPVLSEESAEVPYEERRNWETYWLVDPLDGTKEFIKRNGEFTVNIALIEHGVPVFGVVYAPVLRTLYYGAQAEGMVQGAWRVENCGGKSVEEILSAASPCTMRRAPCGSPLRIVASKSHCNEETEAFIAALEAAYGAIERVSSGSSLKLCMVAEGSADIYPRIAPTMEWDTAAAHAVVAAAGGQVFEYDAGLPVTSYMGKGASEMECGMPDVKSRKTPDASNPPAPANEGHCAPFPLRYNKENLLNPSFIVCGGIE